MYKAMLKSMGSKYVAYAIQFASLVILARVFDPQVFGTVAAVQVFLIFFQLLAEGGLSPAVIGLNSLEKSDRDGIFGFVAVLGIFLGLIFAAIGPLLVWFYKIPELAHVTIYVAVGLVFSAWSILPLALLQRQQSFFKLAVAGALAELAGLASALVINRLVYSPLHALAAKMAITPVVNFCLVYAFSGATEFGRPLVGGKFGAMRPLLKVSGYQLAFNFVNFFSRNLDKILVGKYLGASQLGIYDRSYALMRYPLQLLTFAMAPAIQPVLRKKIDQPRLVYEIHLSLAQKLSLVGLACGAAVYFLAETIIRVFFGPQWISAVPVIKILALSVPVQIVLSTSGSFFQTFQRTDLLFRCGVFSSIINVIAIVYGVRHGVEVLCWALFVSFHINFFQAYYVLHKGVFQQSYSRFLLYMTPGGLGIALLVGWHVSR